MVLEKVGVSTAHYPRVLYLHSDKYVSRGNMPKVGWGASYHPELSMNCLTYELGTIAWQSHLMKRISQHAQYAGLPQAYLGL